ncbi:MAG TPA: RnfABCDGE type electron transport complex subunit B [Candidatus Merdenecus merdavium]|nr:RnfABCDGE type electron transport complex subunit B [Candidatus Merdenecus merdavium]
MNIIDVVMAAVVLGIIGLLIGALLGVASKVFQVEVNEKAIVIKELLPGVNCGACGYPGCEGLANAIAAGEAPVNGCPVGKEKTAKAIAEVMNQ